MTSHSEPPAFLAFDLGASSGRAILGTIIDGRMEMQELHRFRTPIIEQGERLFWDLEALMKELRIGYERALERAPVLKSLSTDSWGVDYVPLDAGGEPIRRPYCYRDPRVVGMMNRAFDTVSREEIYRATGIQFMEITPLYQVLADKALEPDLFARTAGRLMIADYANHRFGGRPVAELSLASTTQALDVHERTWHKGLMERFIIDPSSWPEVVDPGVDIGATPEGVRVIAGCSHDTACAVAAVPAEGSARPWAYLSCGTWSLLGIETPHPIVNDDALAAGFTNEAGLGRTIRFLKNLTGLWVLQECEREWKEAGDRYTYDELFGAAAEAPSPGYFIDLNDSRFGLRGRMQEKLHAWCREQGLTPPADRPRLVRAILESMAEANRKALAELEAVIGYPIEVLHLVGGGSRNALLCRLTADACRCTVVAGPAEATALGNLLIQAQVTGSLPDGLTIRDIVRNSSEVQVFEPAS